MKTIIKQLKKNNNVAVFTHVSPDGDALGSLFSLTHVLKKMGKNVDAYVSGEIPDRLLFLASDFGESYFTDVTDKKYDCCIALDCGDELRLGKYKDMFFAAETTINIDHHLTNNMFAKYNLVKENASSTGEILYGIFKKMRAFDKLTASLVYASIASDTGCFSYSNTSTDTHIYTSELIKLGADYVSYNKKLFDTNTKSALKAQAYAISNMEYFYDGKVAVVTISDSQLEQMGATKQDVEGLIDIPRSVLGVEVAVLVKQTDEKTKLSIRTNDYVDAAAIASMFGGGGHIRASGCTLDMSIDEAKTKIVSVLEEFI